MTELVGFAVGRKVGIAVELAFFDFEVLPLPLFPLLLESKDGERVKLLTRSIPFRSSSSRYSRILPLLLELLLLPLLCFLLLLLLLLDTIRIFGCTIGDRLGSTLEVGIFVGVRLGLADGCIVGFMLGGALGS